MSFMDSIICPNCGAANRPTSRFCSRCGERLPHPEEPSEQAQQGRPALDLPWLQGVQEKAAKPDTERLAAEQIAGEQPIGAPHPQPAQPQPLQPSQQAASVEQQTPQPAEPEQPEQAEQPHSPPDEPPPQWVVGILESTTAAPSNPQQEYEPEELAHIMPWAHDTGEPGKEQPGASLLPPWLNDVTVQETLQASPEGAQEGRASAELELEGIEPFVPPEPEASRPQADLPEQVPHWLQSLGTQKADEPSTSIEAPPEPPKVPTASIAPIEHDIPVRAPRPGAIETLAALVQTGQAAPPQTARKLVPGAVAQSGVAIEAGARRRTQQMRLADGVVYLIILAALLAVLVVQPPFGDVTPSAASDVQQFYNAIEQVPDGEPVLVVYDWDATRSAEMSTLSEAVMNHLMSRRLHFVTVSTTPQGPGFARQITFSVANDTKANYGYRYGQEFLVLGYIPGNEAALTTLVTNFAQAVPLDYVNSRDINSYAIISGGKIRGVSDFALIIVMASEEAELRNWIEQVATRTKVPLIAAVPQGLEPMARPYKNVPGAGLEAVLSGPSGAMQYARQLELGRRTASATLTGANLAVRLNAQSVAQLLVALAIVIALISMGARRILGR